MSEPEHRELLATLLECKGKVMLSGYPSTLYDSTLKNWTRHTFELPNNAAGGETEAPDDRSALVQFLKRLFILPSFRGISMNFDQLIRFAVEQGASDVHLQTGASPLLRISGLIRTVESPPVADRRPAAVHSVDQEGTDRRTARPDAG